MIPADRLRASRAIIFFRFVWRLVASPPVVRVTADAKVRREKRRTKVDMILVILHEVYRCRGR